ncbi:MAG: 8-amino-7-oxononanoate synthase [Cyclobacteriaceae bacterium]
MTDQLLTKLQERKTSGNARRLTSGAGLVDFVSNDYLGLARSEELFRKISSYDYSGIINKNGSAGSRLLAGNSPEHEQLESKLANIFEAESALLFNSGYSANLALVSSIPQKGDTILYDSLSHVCLKEGAWLSKADSISFRHNDLEDLESKLKRARGTIFVIIESVYSMDGDLVPIKDIINLAKGYGGHLIVDEAHSTGVNGKDGAGLVCEMGLAHEFLARVYTFGKGMGVHGACICGGAALIEYLVNFGRPFIYTTALPIHGVFSIDAAFDYLKDHIQLQSLLRDNIRFFNSRYDEVLGKDSSWIKPYSETAIQPIIIPGNDRIKEVANELQKVGLDVRPVLSPTVKAGTERLRISLHTHNTQKQIEKLIQALASCAGSSKKD